MPSTNTPKIIKLLEWVKADTTGTAVTAIAANNKVAASLDINIEGYASVAIQTRPTAGSWTTIGTYTWSQGVSLTSLDDEIRAVASNVDGLVDVRLTLAYDAATVITNN